MSGGCWELSGGFGSIRGVWCQMCMGAGNECIYSGVSRGIGGIMGLLGGVGGVRGIKGHQGDWGLSGGVRSALGAGRECR